MLSRGRTWGRVVTALIAGAVVLPASAPAAQRLYLSGTGATPTPIAGFDLTADGGVGPQLPGSPFPAGSGGAEGLAITPDGSALYAVGSTGDVFGFAVGGGGALTPTGRTTAPGALRGIVTSPDGRFVYAADDGGAVLAFSRAATGALTAIPSSIPAPVSPAGLAMAPDERHLYVADSGSNVVLTYAIGADGSLSSAPGTAVPGGLGARAIALNPTARFLYVTGSTVGSQIRTYAIAADGSLSAVGSPVPTGGDGASGMTLVPDGARLYVANRGSPSIAAFSIGVDGAPVALAGSPVPMSDAPAAVALNAAGDRLYASSATSASTGVFALGSTGLPAPLAGSPFPTGLSGGFQSVALTPDQPPTASFTTKVNNKRIAFDATGSTDPDGTVARYDWDFGDGGTLANGGPTPTHKYRGPKQPATLTVSDATGCSTAYVSAGVTPFCNGGPSARLMLTAFQAKLHAGASRTLGRAVRVKLSCPVACDVKVVGRVKLSGGRTRAKRATLKSAKAKLKPGRPKTLKLRLSGKGRRDAAAAKKAAARLKITAHDDSGDQFKVKQTIGLR